MDVKNREKQTYVSHFCIVCGIGVNKAALAPPIHLAVEQRKFQLSGGAE